MQCSCYVSDTNNGKFHAMSIAYGTHVILGSANVNVSYIKLMFELIWCYAGDIIKVSANGNGNVIANVNVNVVAYYVMSMLCYVNVDAMFMFFYAM